MNNYSLPRVYFDTVRTASALLVRTVDAPHSAATNVARVLVPSLSAQRVYDVGDLTLSARLIYVVETLTPIPNPSPPSSGDTRITELGDNRITAALDTRITE